MERRASSPVRREVSGLPFPSKRRDPEATTGNQGCQSEREFVGIISLEDHNPENKKYGADEESDQVGGVSNRSRGSREVLGHDLVSAKPLPWSDTVLHLPKLPLPFLTGFFLLAYRRKAFLRPNT
jgi:hypothetical protein